MSGMEKRTRFFNRETTFGGKCIISGILASIAFVASPLEAATLTATQATFVQNDSLANTNFGTNTTLQVANRNLTSRKTYLEFNLASQLGSGETFSTSSLTITTANYLATGSPSIGTPTGNGIVTFSIYGLINGAAWSESTLTWNNANTVGNDVASNTAVVASATTLLGTITINTTGLSEGVNFTLSSPELVQYLNWAAGTLGDFYQTGITSDLLPTFIITAQGTSLNSAGVAFASDEFATAAYRPSLAFTTAAVPEPGTLGLIALGFFAAFQLRRFSKPVR